MSSTTTTTYEASGSHTPTVKDILLALSGWPEGAFVNHFEVGDSQRDGSWWRARAVITR